MKKEMRKRKGVDEAHISTRDVAVPQEERICSCHKNTNGCQAQSLLGKHQTIFTEFQKLDYNSQSYYLSQLITLEEPKRRRGLQATSRRHYSFKYSLDNTRVCQKTFCYILGITGKRVQCLIEKLKTNTDIRDRRGLHNCGKKKQPHTDNWQQNVRKRQRDAGEAYISSRGVQKPAIAIPLEERVCSCLKNTNGCQAQSLVGRHRSIFFEFRKLDYNAQSRYISQSITLEEPKRRRFLGATSRRHYSVRYSLNNIRICQKTFRYILGITGRRVQCLVDKLKTNTDIDDHRGQHRKKLKKIAPSDHETVCAHINSILLRKNDWSIEQTSSLCFDLNKMHALFCRQYPESTVSAMAYGDIFRKNFDVPSTPCSFFDKFFMKLYGEENTVFIKNEESSGENEETYRNFNEDTTKFHVKTEACNTEENHYVKIEEACKYLKEDVEDYRISSEEICRILKEDPEKQHAQNEETVVVKKEITEDSVT